MAFLAPLLGPVVNEGLKVIERVLPDRAAQDAAKAAYAQAMMEHDWSALHEQLAVNLEEAKSEKWWKAGWRPAIGWVCASALGYTYIGQPLLIYLVNVAGWAHGGLVGAFPQPPALNTSDLMTVLLGMLGLGGLRTVEKLTGVAGDKPAAVPAAGIVQRVKSAVTRNDVQAS